MLRKYPLVQSTSTLTMDAERAVRKTFGVQFLSLFCLVLLDLERAYLHIADNKSCSFITIFFFSSYSWVLLAVKQTPICLLIHDPWAIARVLRDALTLSLEILLAVMFAQILGRLLW